MKFTTGILLAPIAMNSNTRAFGVGSIHPSQARRAVTAMSLNERQPLAFVSDSYDAPKDLKDTRNDELGLGPILSEGNYDFALEEKSSFETLDLMPKNSALSTKKKQRAKAPVRLKGIDKDKFDKADVCITFPLEPGEHIWPTNYVDAKVHIPQDTTMTFKLAIQPNKQGEAEIQTFELCFSNPLVIKNPASAFNPNIGAFAGIKDFVSDVIGNAIFSGLRMTETGALKREGFVHAPFLGYKSELDVDDEAIESNKLPRVTRKLSALKRQGLITKSSPQKPVSQEPDTEDMLRALADFIGRGGRFEVNAESKDGDVTIDAGWMGKSSGHGITKIRTRGDIDVDKTGQLSIQMRPEEAAYVRTPVGKAKVSGAARTQVKHGQKPHIVGDLDFEAELGRVHGGPIGFIASAAAWFGAAFTAKGKIEADFDGDEIHINTPEKPKLRLAGCSKSID